MTVTTEQFVNGVIAFADAEMIPLMRNQGQQLVSGIAIALMQRRAIDKLDSLTKNPVVEALGVIDNEGMINIDALLNAAITSMNKYSDGKLEFNPRVLMGGIGGLMGDSYTSFTFSVKDLQNLHSYIRDQAGYGVASEDEDE